MSENLLHPDAIKDDQKEKKRKTSKEPRTSQQILRSLFLSLIALALIVTASFVHKYYNGNLQEEETSDQTTYFINDFPLIKG